MLKRLRAGEAAYSPRTWTAPLHRHFGNLAHGEFRRRWPGRPAAASIDIDQADLLCLYGHNVAESPTVLWVRMVAVKRRNGGRIMVADPRKTPTVRQGAYLHLQLRTGTNVALMNTC